MEDVRIARWDGAAARTLDTAGCRWWTCVGCVASVPIVGVSMIALSVAGLPGPLFIVPVLLAGSLLFAPSRFRRRMAVEESEEFEADAGEVPVEVRLSLVDHRVGTWATGRDVGMLCHEGGWLVFRGRRSQWSVRTLGGKLVTERGFRFSPPGGYERDVTFAALDRDDRVSALLAEWARATCPEGAEVLPPITVPDAGPKTIGWVAVPVATVVFVLWLAQGPDLAAILFIGTIALMVLAAVIATARIRRNDLHRAGAIE